MREQCDRFGVRVLCYCLMSNHVHLLALPSTPSGLARGVAEAHRRYTLHINKRMTVRGYLFQGLFSSCPTNGEHALAAERNDLLGHCPNVRAWRKLTRSNEEGRLDRIRRATCTGRPLGSQGFNREVKLATGRRIQQKAPGRPKREK